MLDEEEEKKEQIIANEFILLNEISQGGFGKVYICQSIKSQKKYAIKLERSQEIPPKMSKHITSEYKIYKMIQGALGFPRVYCFATKFLESKTRYYYMPTDNSISYLVHELLGPSLGDLFDLCKHRFSLKTVLMIADQALSRLEYIHNKRIVHRDVKPENFLIGQSNNSNVIYMIDFGLSKTISENREPVYDPLDFDPEFVGTSRFAAISAHLGFEQSQKDDLESLAYSFVYLLKGKLPWQGFEVSDKKLKCHLIAESKQGISSNLLFEGMPIEFFRFFCLVRNLKFNQRPNYSLYREMFRNLMINEGYVYDYQYDWVVLQKTKANIDIDEKSLLIIQPETVLNRNLRNSQKRISNESKKIIEFKNFKSNDKSLKNQQEKKLTKSLPEWIK